MSGFTQPVRPKARSATTGAPATTDIVVGELAVNVRDGTMFMNYTPGGGAQTILRFATTIDLALLAPLASPVFTGTITFPSTTVPGFLTPIQTKTAAYTALQTDNNSTIVVNSASAVAMTLPTLAAGTTITFVQRGAGKVTWTASGTTVTVYPSGSTGSAGAGAQWTAVWDTTTTILIGGAVS